LTELIHLNLFFGKCTAPNQKVGQDRSKFKKTNFKTSQLLCKSCNKFRDRFRPFGAGSSLLPSLFSPSSCGL